MAQNVNIDCAAGVWTQLTDADVTAIRVQNLSDGHIKIMATTGTSAPSGAGGALTLLARDIVSMDVAELFPGVTPGYRIWAHSGLGASLSVSHA